MTKEEFVKFYKGRKVDGFEVEIDLRGGKDNECSNPIGFLKEFTKVFDDWFTSICVDENIGLITDFDDGFYNKEFLDECISKGLKNKEAHDLYRKQLEDGLDGLVLLAK